MWSAILIIFDRPSIRLLIFIDHNIPYCPLTSFRCWPKTYLDKSKINKIKTMDFREHGHWAVIYKNRSWIIRYIFGLWTMPVTRTIDAIVWIKRMISFILLCESSTTTSTNHISQIQINKHFNMNLCQLKEALYC